MSTTMDLDQIPDKIPTQGVIALLLAALSATPLWRYLTKRKALDAAQERDRVEHSQEIELRKVDAAEAEDRKLIRVLEGQIKDLRGEVLRLSGLVDGLIGERTGDKVTIATQAARIVALEADLKRAEAAAEDYRKTAEAAQQALIDAGRPAAAQQIGDEISETAEAHTPTRSL
jgi:TolA-binding protein